MKAPTLDDVVAAWSTIPVDERAGRLAILKAGPKVDPDAPLVVRWTPAARQASMTTRGLRKAAKLAGIRPVTLPGRTRSIGILHRDLLALVGAR